MKGVYRFLGRVWRLLVDEDSETAFEQELTVEPSRGLELLAKVQLNKTIQNAAPTASQLKTLHACIKKVTEDLDGMRFNTAISAMMVFVNDAIGWEIKPASALADFLVLLQPFAPHLAEELWSKLKAGTALSGLALAYQPWPKHDPQWLLEESVELALQINGKLRDRITVAVDASEEAVKAAALASEKIQPFLAGKAIKKVIVVPKKLVNIAVA